MNELYREVTPLKSFDVPEVLEVHEVPSVEVRMVPEAPAPALASQFPQRVAGTDASIESGSLELGQVKHRRENKMGSQSLMSKVAITTGPAPGINGRAVNLYRRMRCCFLDLIYNFLLIIIFQNFDTLTNKILMIFN